jgi:hypothetical protein
VSTPPLTFPCPSLRQLGVAGEPMQTEEGQCATLLVWSMVQWCTRIQGHESVELDEEDRKYKCGSLCCSSAAAPAVLKLTFIRSHKVLKFQCSVFHPSGYSANRLSTNTPFGPFRIFEQLEEEDSPGGVGPKRAKGCGRLGGNSRDALSSRRAGRTPDTRQQSFPPPPLSQSLPSPPAPLFSFHHV